jgi:RNA polymerase sigma-70 factor, ECF subfamily
LDLEPIEETIAETIAYDPPTPQRLTEEDVLSALERIPRDFQVPVVLADVEDLSYREIADALQIPLGTVMSRLSRGRKLLRMELANYARGAGYQVAN